MRDLSRTKASLLLVLQICWLAAGPSGSAYAAVARTAVRAGAEEGEKVTPTIVYTTPQYDVPERTRPTLQFTGDDALLTNANFPYWLMGNMFHRKPQQQPAVTLVGGPRVIVTANTPGQVQAPAAVNVHTIVYDPFHKTYTQPGPPPVAKPQVAVTLIGQPAVGVHGAPAVVPVVAGAQAEGSCLNDVINYSHDHVCWSRAVLANEPQDGNQDYEITNVKSCRSVAFFLDYLFIGTHYTAEKNHAPRCGEANNFWRCFDEDEVLATAMQANRTRKAMFWHYRLPADTHVTPRDEHNIGHHWVVEMSFRNGEPGFVVYMSYQDMYPLSDWLDDKAKPQGNVYDRGRRLNWEQFRELMRLTRALSDWMRLGKPCVEISALYRKLTSVSFSDVKNPLEPNRCAIQNPGIARILVASLPYDSLGCQRRIREARAHCAPGQVPTSEDLLF